MNLLAEKSEQEQIFVLLSILQKFPHITQRELARQLNVSLGKTNYLLRRLVEKGFIRKTPLSRHVRKTKKSRYRLTKAGLEEKVQLTYRFLKMKEMEYQHLKEEWESLLAIHKETGFEAVS